MHLVRKFRLSALFCALAVLLCELVSQPFTPKGVFDDWPYILMVQHLASTGHVVYNGWSAPMLGWQLYLAAAFVKLFGSSFTTVRMSTLLISVVVAFVLQRSLVRAGVNERNAIIGTLAFVLSPLYLMLSVTFMTDIAGLLAIVLCLYGCLRALQAATPSATVGWLCFAVGTDAVCGTARQIAWLGVLVMVPSALWLLRANRRVLLSGATAALAGALFVFRCMQWLRHQPYTVPVPLIPKSFPVAKICLLLSSNYLNIPFLLLPIFVLFVPQIRTIGSRFISIVATLFASYMFLATYPSHLRGSFPLEPIHGMFITAYGIFEGNALYGRPAIFLHPGVRVVITLIAFGGLLGLIIAVIRNRRSCAVLQTTVAVSGGQLGVLLAPFAIVSTLIFICLAANYDICDRYLLELLVVPLFCLLRYYQDRIHRHIPFGSVLMVAVMAIFGVALTHNLFAFYRARAALMAELSAEGIPPTTVDNGWEFNIGVELEHASHINNRMIVIPADAYIPSPPLRAGTCPMLAFDSTPHIHPVYGVSFDPSACYGDARIPPVQYSRWLASSPGTLYVVRYLPPSQE